MRCQLDGADVRHLTMHGRRALTRLYIAVRDEIWNTIPFECSKPELDIGRDSFRAWLACEVDEEPIRAEWTATVEGSSEGRFRYTIDGQMLGSFRYAKLGLNLHHPLPETLGSRYVASSGGGEPFVGVIPTAIDPQLFIDGKLTAMFAPYMRLELGSPATGTVVFRFEGDEFEMQDHRNWTDYNLKSYGTPLSIPLPLAAEPGDRIFQSVEVDLSGLLDGIAGGAAATPRSVMRVERSRVVVLPRIGSEFPDELERLEESQATLVRSAGLDFVRVNVDVTSPDGSPAAIARIRQIDGLGVPMELGVFSSPGEERPDEIRILCDWLAAEQQLAIERVLLLEGPRGFAIGGRATAGAKVRAYRDAIAAVREAVPVISGTDQFFAELNRYWPELAGVDGVTYTINPQVHAADDESLMENVWGQLDTVRTARARTGGRPVHAARSCCWASSVPIREECQTSRSDRSMATPASTRSSPPPGQSGR